MDPLVSVIVVTFNSAKYVLETLESINKQTYKNIELIVSDDFSTDNTIEICRKWLNTNSERFCRTDLITTVANTGTTANNNRGLNAAGGEWLKFIAGDDILHPSCIEVNMHFVKSEPEAKVIISKYQIFNSNFNVSNFVNIRPPDDFIDFFSLDADKQLKIMRFRSEHLILGMFINARTLKSINGFDESYKLLEDLPLLLNVLMAGHKFYHLPSVTSYYRRNINTVSNPRTKIYKVLLKELFRAYRKLRRPYLDLAAKIHNDIYFINEFILTYGFKGKRNIVFEIVAISLKQLSPIHHRMRNEIRNRKKGN